MSMSTKEPGSSTDVMGGYDCPNILIWVYKYLQWLKNICNGSNIFGMAK